MKIFINRIEANKEILNVNDGLNYGRFFDKKTDEYKIQLTSFEVIDLIEKEYIKTRDEIKIDDEAFGDSSGFTSTNYCSLSKLMEYESEFEEILKAYFHITLLKKIFSKSTKNEYVINSTDSVKIKKGEIILKGKVFYLSKT